MSKRYGGPLGWLRSWNFRRVEKRRWQRKLLEALAEDDAAIMESLSRLLEGARVAETARAEQTLRLESQLTDGLGRLGASLAHAQGAAQTEQTLRLESQLTDGLGRLGASLAHAQGAAQTEQTLRLESQLTDGLGRLGASLARGQGAARTELTLTLESRLTAGLARLEASLARAQGAARTEQSLRLELQLADGLARLEAMLAPAALADKSASPSVSPQAEPSVQTTSPARLAYVGHSHHRVTGSTRFLIDLLARSYEVTTFWNEAWRNGAELDLGLILSGGFDAVVVFQDEPIAARLADAGLPNVTFFPMYDDSHGLPDARWQALAGIKIVSFSRTVHEHLARLGLKSHYVQYFPDPACLRPVDHSQGLSGFFWQRQQDITWRTIQPLLGAAPFRRFTLHRAIDPTFGTFVAPPPDDVERYGIRETDWFPDKASALADLASHNVYFAPRLREGIGQSFLEAMAMGFLVVAPDHPTMNEYIVSGVNGLLYDPDRPVALDFSHAADLGKKARRSVELGHARWVRDSGALLEFVRAPMSETDITKKRINEESIIYKGFATLDPCGRVFECDGKIFRGIYPAQESYVRRIFNSGLVTRLVGEGLLVGTEISECSSKSYPLILEHKSLVSSLPTDWSFSMVRDAVLTILRVNEICNEYGYELGDAHLYNVCFERSQAKWVDFGSIKEWLGGGWSAASEFVDFSVVPLVLMARGDLLTAYSLLQAVRSFKLAAGPFRKSSVFREFLRLIDHTEESFKDGLITEDWISRFCASRERENSFWGGYQEGPSEISRSIEVHEKNRFKRFFEIPPLILKYASEARTSVDLAGSSGVASIILYKHTNLERLINIDYDSIAIDTSYEYLRNNSIFPVESYLLNFMIPMQQESIAAFKSDIAFALAVTHHLLLSQGHKIDGVFEKIKEYSNRYVFVEFMPLGLWGGDPKQKPDIPDWYNVEWFVANFKKHFRLLTVETIEHQIINGVSEAHRVLLVGEMCV